MMAEFENYFNFLDLNILYLFYFIFSFWTNINFQEWVQFTIDI